MVIGIPITCITPSISSTLKATPSKLNKKDRTDELTSFSCRPLCSQFSINLISHKPISKIIIPATIRHHHRAKWRRYVKFGKGPIEEIKRRKHLLKQ
ncbi:hypothetical protein, partial [Mucilaginibacter humi]|uniref:hypothetical protein n=1 Tax=Mucilaginibacter humi TaxID=2732510 RepID=UPI001FE382C0